MLKKGIFIFAGVLVLLIACTTYNIYATNDNVDNFSKREIIASFPKNESGQTYGSSANAATLRTEPDLISAYGIDGKKGYVKKADLYEPMPKTPEDAVSFTKNAVEREILLYEKDGKTIIGKFIVDPGSSQ
jgi:uncharacterized protein YxeA